MTKTFGRLVVLVVAVGVSACSSHAATTSAGSGSGSGSAEGLPADPTTGSVGGATLTVQGATALVGQTTDLLGTTTEVALVGLTSASGATCATLTGGQAASATGLTLLIVSKTPVEPMTYPIEPSTQGAPHLPAVLAVFSRTNASCISVYDGGGPDVFGGTVTISEISSATVVGTYSVTFADGTLAGSFSAPVCRGVNLNEVFSADASTPACIQP